MKKIPLFVALIVVGLVVVIIGVFSTIKQRVISNFSASPNNPSPLQTVTSEIVMTPTPTPPYDLHDLQRKAEIESAIRPALEVYRSDYKRYPDTLKEMAPKYLVIMPLDPAHKSEYFYQVSQTKLNYTLSANMDDGTTYVTHAPQ